MTFPPHQAPRQLSAAGGWAGGTVLRGDPGLRMLFPTRGAHAATQLSCAHGDLRELKLPLHKRSLKDIGN